MTVLYVTVITAVQLTEVLGYLLHKLDLRSYPGTALYKVQLYSTVPG